MNTYGAVKGTAVGVIGFPAVGSRLSADSTAIAIMLANRSVAVKRCAECDPMPADPSMLSETLDSLREGLQILSPEWRYLYVNAAVARQGRKAPADLLGRTMSECFPGIERTPLFATLQRCLEQREATTLETEFAFEDGARAWFELRIQPCAAGLVIVSLDMSERKGVELQLRDAYHQALHDLVTPVIRVHKGVLLVPVIGALDHQRARQMTEAVLARSVEDRAKAVIFDIAGVPEVDTAVAKHLLEAAAMIRLLGASTVLTGLSPSAAKTLVHLGLDLSAMETTSELAEGIELALRSVGKKIVAR